MCLTEIARAVLSLSILSAVQAAGVVLFISFSTRLACMQYGLRSLPMLLFAGMAAVSHRRLRRLLSHRPTYSYGWLHCSLLLPMSHLGSHDPPGLWLQVSPMSLTAVTISHGRARHALGVCEGRSAILCIADQTVKHSNHACCGRQTSTSVVSACSLCLYVIGMDASPLLCIPGVSCCTQRWPEGGVVQQYCSWFG